MSTSSRDARRHGSGHRPGMSLIELVIALTILTLIFSAAVPLFRTQVRSVSASAGRSDALQNARFAINAIDRDLRMAGVGITDARQPLLVQAGAFAVTFSADLITSDSADAWATYYAPGTTDATTRVLAPADQVALPLGGQSYPDSLYYESGTSGPRSKAETISYWASLDSTSTRSDEYVLFRRVNADTVRVVTKSIIVPAGKTLFRYFSTTAAGVPVEVPASRLPLYHSSAVHGTGVPADTGASALTDSVRIVAVSLTGYYKDPSGTESRRPVTGVIRLLNAGMIRRSTCGDTPLPVALTATASTGKVTLVWSASADQGGGENDISRYVLYKREQPSANWGEPFTSIPASQSVYTLDDAAVTNGKTYDYGVVAQDCSPANSTMSTASATP